MTDWIKNAAEEIAYRAQNTQNLGVPPKHAGIRAIAAVAEEIIRKHAPCWREHPTVPGLWVIEMRCKGPANIIVFRFVQEHMHCDLPSWMGRVYGPIPEHKEPNNV